jgi:hypothetical protein
MSEVRTNAREFLSGQKERLELPFSYKVRSKIYSLLRRFISMDEFEWDLYDIHYRAEIAWNNRFFTEDLSIIDFKFSEGRIYILGDCKPLNLTCRCVYETIYNLPAVTSFAEIGVGGGRFTANLRTMMGEHVRFSAYDLSEKQLLFFKEQYPDVYSKTSVGVLDLTKNSIPEAEKPDVVLASTVLMHIQTPGAYQRALQNLLQSGRKYVVLMDNWNAHNYFFDLTANLGKRKLYFYDSGANICIIIDLQGEILDIPYQPLNKSSALGKYIQDYKY